METIDELTGLLQRSALLEKLEESLKNAAQTQSRLVLVALDIDRLYYINKDHGFRAGDAVIRHSAQAFMKKFGASVPSGRYDKDMYLAGVSGVTTEAAYSLAEELRKEIEHSIVEYPLNDQNASLSYTVTLGIAVYPDDAPDLPALIERATQALRRAKDAGHNTTCLYEEKDQKTGLLNRFGILRKLEQICLDARKQGQTVSLMMVDIDEFKALNDRFGHLGGDQVLRRLAFILQSNFKEDSFVGRFAGDEFMIVLPDCRPESAFILAEEVRRLIEETDFSIKTDSGLNRAAVRISGGIATYPGDALEMVDLVRKADEALYRAKSAGRNRIFLPVNAQMVLKTSYYTATQLERLSRLAKSLEKSEAFLLREALDNLLDQYEEQVHL